MYMHVGLLLSLHGIGGRSRGAMAHLNFKALHSNSTVTIESYLNLAV